MHRSKYLKGLIVLLSSLLIVAVLMQQSVTPTRSAGEVGARVYDTDIGFLGNNAWAAWPFNSERYDYGTLHSTATNTSRLTASAKCVYAITGHISFPTNTTGERGIRVRENGATVIAVELEEAIGTFAHVMSIATLYELDTNDYVELQLFQNSGGSLGITNASNYSPEFAMHCVEHTP